MTKKSIITALLTSLIFITSNAQEDETFLITPELTNKMSEHKGLIYPVLYEDVEFPVYKKGEKLTKYYLEQKEELLKYKPDHLSYVKEEKSLIKKYADIQSILNYIEDFNKSKEKYKEKIHYLITAQEIADKSNLELIKQSGNVNIPSREILLYNPKKRSNEDDLTHYKQYIKDIKLETPYKTQEYKRYENLEKYIKTIDSTEDALIKTNEVSLKKVFMAKNEPIEVNSLNGTFTKLKDSYMLVYSDFEDQYLKNQLVNPIGSYSSSLKVSKRFTIIKNINTEDYYYLTDDRFLSDLTPKNNIEDYMALLKKNGFSSTLDGDILYINTNKGKIRATYDIYEEVQKGNFAYINEVSISVIEFKRIVTQQANPMTEKLANHFSAHQNGTMTTSRLNIWKNDTKKAISILKSLKGLRGNEEDIEDYFLRKIDNKTSYDYNEFLQILNGTKIVLGM